MTAACAACAKRPRRARGWCNPCYMRWVRAGRPDEGPPPPADPTPVITCEGCHQNHRHAARNLCKACYGRWLRAGKPATCPPPRRNQWTPETQAAAQATRRANREYRIGEYAFLLSVGETRETAAQRIGVTVWSAWRYDKELQKEAV